MQPRRQADGLKSRGCEPIDIGDASDFQRRANIVVSGHRLEEVERLEDQTHAPAPQFGECILAFADQACPKQRDIAFGGLLNA